MADNGGHLASNLGVVELTVALHRVFTLPEDCIVWDVGHQSYAHKLLTGREEAFSTLRREDGLSGFPSREESDCDPFTTGTAARPFLRRSAFPLQRHLRVTPAMSSPSSATAR